MKNLKFIKTRRSVRLYDEKQITKEMLEEIIDCARLAPSARNKQPWEFIVITKKSVLEKIAEIATYGKFIKNAAACIIVCGDHENHHLVEDGSAATENILLAASALGIGGCWVAGWQKAYCREIKELLGIPEEKDIVSILPLGYPKMEVPAPPKRPLDEVLHWEKF